MRDRRPEGVEPVVRNVLRRDSRDHPGDGIAALPE
jgi:hypothetical protein